ncbi:hypothetical protein AB0I89_26550 [Micromonospora sp. NPDC049801]|uniref:hypothetical protein n=1 Tax=unclassified Micromonospora TaxID=2617518 RepID=UPI0033CBE5EE
MRTAEAIDLVTAARTDAELFGADQPARRYRELVAALHPDRLPTDPGYAPTPSTRSSTSRPGGRPGGPPSSATTGSARRRTRATWPTCTTSATTGCSSSPDAPPTTT